MKRELTCIVCPKGCPLQVELDGRDVKSVTGYTCKRGLQYAIDECTHPMRTVTSTIRLTSGGVIPVKTANPIPRERIFDLMALLAKTRVKPPIAMGDVLIPNALDLGIDVIATADFR